MIAVELVNKGPDVEIAVRDTGVGIAKHDLPRIFDRFYRGDSTREGGTCLGLTVVQRLVEIQGGTVNAQSKLNERPTIAFQLPSANSKVTASSAGGEERSKLTER